VHNPLLDFYCQNYTTNKFLYNFELRYQAIAKYSWAVPNLQALEAIRDLGGPIDEWYAGAGYWAYCLRQLGVCITSYTLDLGCQGESVGNTKSWTKVYKCMATAPLQIKAHVLLLVWPPLGLSDQVLRVFTGTWVVHVGESNFKILTDHWSLVQVLDIPQWLGLHDAVYIYKKIT